MTARIHIRLVATDDDPGRLEQSTAVLRAELLELDVEDVSPVSAGQAPLGSRAFDVAEIGSLLVTVTHVPEALRQLVLVVRGWLTRDPGVHSVELILGDDKLVVNGASSQTEQRLVEAWLKAHGLDGVEQSD